MSPLDDELRDALHSRTSSVTSSPDLFAGVEHKARRMKRQRAAGAVAGSALAVSALALGGPLVASSLTGGASERAPLATAAPEPPPGASPFALDPDDPWAYRGDDAVLHDGSLETMAREWGVRHAVEESEVRFTPLYGELYEPAAAATVVFLAQGPEGGPRWGVVLSGEGGPEFLLDEPLREGTAALPAALPGDEVARLLVVASPEVGELQYGPDAVSEWSTMESTADGVAVTALEGDPATDRYRVLDEQGGTVVQEEAPDPDPSAAPPDEGTETPVEVDDAAYALDLSDPWAYRGPAELTQHPDLGVEDDRLFAQNGTGRGDGSWSSRPLLGVEGSDGLSVLMVLHHKGDEAYVTTTWQRQDEAPRQSEQPVRDGQLLVQSVLPDAGPAGVLLALASPRAGAVETDLVPPQRTGATPGVGIFELPADPSPGEVLLYSEGDGLLYHAEPARRS